MATPATAPSTPEAKTKMQLNRSFTMPTKLNAQSQSIPPESALDAVETLYHHNDASVFKFTTSHHMTPSKLGKERGLPWTSPRETRVAVGPLQIYRVPESVSFLRSGDLLQAIMPRSQCWCVDGVSKFAMRVMHETYYRIELPAETTEDQAKVEEFKKVLGTVMFYERSACPFARGFDEDLPEMEDISERKMSKVGTQWLQERKAALKRRQTNLEQVPEAGSARLSLDETRPGPAMLRRAKRDDAVFAPAADVTASSDGDQNNSRPYVAKRSVTVPSRLQMYELGVEAAQKSAARSAGDGKIATLQSIPTDMPPSPPYSSTENDGVADRQVGEADLLDLAGHEQGTEEAASKVQSSGSAEQPKMHHADIGISQAETLNDEPQENDQVIPHEETIDVAAHSVGPSDTAAQPRGRIEETQSFVRPGSDNDDPFAAIQARILARRSIGGTTSFYPPIARESTACSTTSVSTVSSTRSTASHRAQHNLATALVKKACDVFLGPPAHLVLMMLRIAARFSNGTLGKMLFVESPSGASQRIPGSFSVSEDAFGEGVSDEEDDFGVPFTSPIRVATARNVRERMARGVKEID